MFYVLRLLQNIFTLLFGGVNVVQLIDDEVEHGLVVFFPQTRN